MLAPMLAHMFPPMCTHMSALILVFMFTHKSAHMFAWLAQPSRLARDAGLCTDDADQGCALPINASWQYSYNAGAHTCLSPVRSLVACMHECTCAAHISAARTCAQGGPSSEDIEALCPTGRTCHAPHPSCQASGPIQGVIGGPQGRWFAQAGDFLE